MTGAANGIGLACAELLAASGAKVGWYNTYFGDTSNRVSTGGAIIGKDGLDLSRLTISKYQRFYVDCDNGDDENDGSSGSPFKTIQKAIDTIPIVALGQDVSIKLKSSQNYNEHVTILEYTGNHIQIESETGNPDDVKITLKSGESEIFLVQKSVLANIGFYGLTLVINDDDFPKK